MRDKKQQNFYTSLRYYDDRVKEVLDVLESDGRRDDLVILYTPDNGINMLNSKARWAPGENGVRLPMLLSAPEIGSAASTVALGHHVDILATILDYAGASNLMTDNAYGKSLKPLAAGTTPQSLGWREFLIDSGHTNNNIPTNTLNRSILDLNGFKLYKRVKKRRGDIITLYNLNDDPAEKNRLNNDDYSGVINDLLLEIVNWETTRY